MFRFPAKTLAAALLGAALLFNPADARSVRDIKGNAVEIPDQVNRIADLWPANNQVVLLLGGADKLVGTVEAIHKRPWFAKVYPRIKQVPALSNGLSVQSESLLAARPDVVLLSQPSMQQQVKQAGLKTVLVNFQTYDGLKKTVSITADVIGGKAPQIAKQYNAELDANIRLVSERTKNIPAAQKPLVLHLFDGKNLRKIDGGRSIIGDWVRIAGGRTALPNEPNIAEVPMEEIVKANPDIIIIGGRDAAQAIAKIRKDPAWQSIKAVKNKRLHANPGGTFGWDRYSAEGALQVLWAGKLLHPARFNDVDIATKTQAFYQKYYRYNLSKSDAQRIVDGLDPQ